MSDIDLQARFGRTSKAFTHQLQDDFKHYISNPGRVVQTVRKIPMYIRSGQVQHSTISKARDFFLKSSSDLSSPGTTELYELVK